MASESTSEVALIAEKKCTNSDYGDTFLDGLRKMRVGQKLCDFSLDVQGEIIYVHKVALALASDYFASIFETDMKERREGVIKLEDVDIPTIKTLVEYMYSGIITLTAENVENLLSIADLYQILWVKEQCAQFLKPINQSLIKDEQRKNSMKFVESAYKASINWIKRDLEQRKAHLRELMSHIHLPCVSTEFLRNHVVGEPMVIEDQKCSKSLIEALSERCSTERRSTERRSTETKSENEMVFLFLAGGYELERLNILPDYRYPVMENKKTACNNFEVYDVSKNKLVTLSNMAQSRYDNSAISLNGVIYSIGGCDSNNTKLATAECYYPLNKQWNSIAPMTVGRSNFGICAYHQVFYVVGGNSTGCVEKYDPARNRWERCSSIPEHSQLCTRAALAEHSIYGFTNSSCFRFDPRQGYWSVLDAMRTRRGRFELLSNDRSLFCIGSEHARFDVHMNKWELMEPPPLLQGGNFTAMIAADNIYLLDGTVKRYSIPNNEWTTVSATSFAYRGGAGAVLTGSFNFNETMGREDWLESLPCRLEGDDLADSRRHGRLSSQSSLPIRWQPSLPI
uniref:Kelch-like protein diablo n=1 Tax=Glossina pallidipes TaxID=7398 RepID=A0A1B0AAM1_GLOPL